MHFLLNTSLRRGALFGAALAMAAALPAHAQALNDPAIVGIFDAANTIDIEASTLAGKKATRQDIKDLANQFVRDHTQLRQQGRDLAKKLGVTPTPPPSSFPLAQSHAEAMKKLQSLSGKDFDTFYLQNEVDYHDAVISAVTNTLLPAIQNAELKAFVQKAAPAFQAHEVAAKNLLEKVK